MYRDRVAVNPQARPGRIPEGSMYEEMSWRAQKSDQARLRYEV